MFESDRSGWVIQRLELRERGDSSARLDIRVRNNGGCSICLRDECLWLLPFYS